MSSLAMSSPAMSAIPRFGANISIRGPENEIKKMAAADGLFLLPVLVLITI